jgi:hypothetical protein
MVVFEGFRSKFELSGNAVNYRICRYFQPINENAYYQKQFRGLFCFQKKRPANGFLGVAQSPKSSGWRDSLNCTFYFLLYKWKKMKNQ